MFKYFFEFEGDTTVVVEADTKLKATTILSEKYTSLFESQNYRVVDVDFELDKTGTLVEGEETSDVLKLFTVTKKAEHPSWRSQTLHILAYSKEGAEELALGEPNLSEQDRGTLDIIELPLQEGVIE